MKYQENNKSVDMVPIPFSLYIGEGLEFQDFFYCCEEMVDVVLALNGSVVVQSGEIEMTLEEGELMVINRLCPFMVKQNGTSVFLIFKLDSCYFNKFYPKFSENIYQRNGVKGDYGLRELIAKIVCILQNEGKEYRMKLEKLLFQVALELMKNYVDNKFKDKKGCRTHIESIATYIGQNYYKNISLGELAKYVHLNEQYLSRYFSSQMGITISEYINIQRLYHSLELLKYTDDNILDIALKCGFANVKSYYKACKRYLGQTPTQYRSEQRKSRRLTSEQYRVLRHQALGKLYRYKEKKSVENKLVQVVKIDRCEKEGHLNKVWNRVLAFGKASDGLKAEMRKQLKILQKEIPFNYVRFHGIFSDEMQIYHEDSGGNAYYNFYYVDELLDFLLEIKLKPYIELGFMPEKLASGKKYMFAWRANVSMPKSMEKWEHLVCAFLNHLVERYGREEVRSWYFEIWNDPDLIGKFKPLPVKTGFPFFKVTYESIKKVDDKFIVGGINTFSNISLDKVIKSYFDYFKKENIELDFVSFSLYGLKAEEWMERHSDNDFFQDEKSDFISPQSVVSELYFADILESKERIVELKNKLKKVGFKGEFIINEWNLIPDPRELINDTCFKAAYFVAIALEMDEFTQALAYWTFSDIFDEVSLKLETFHGGIGFVTRNGLKKPVYYAYELLNRLAHNILAKGDSFIATKSDEGVIYVLLYNYCRLKNYKFRQINNEDRYSYCEEVHKEFCLELVGYEGHYIQNCYRINRGEGSVYDLWKGMGEPKTIRQEHLRFLMKKSLYHFDTKEVFLINRIDIPIQLLPHEVVLLEWVPVDTH